MTKYLMLIGIPITIFITVLLKKNINNKKVKYIMLVSPFALAGILYLGVVLITKNMPPDVCDGAAIIGIIISFLLLGMGIVLNLINIVFHLVLTHK